MTEHSLQHIEFPFTGRFATIGKSGAHVRELIYVLHGHGQQAQFFVQKFNGIASDQRLIVAPEGLSRYYLEGFTGRVGATWMTKEDRETDIANYISFLNTLHHQIKDLNPGIESITVVGFSQGAATATRWVNHSTMVVKRFILWAGILPYDMNISKAKDRLESAEKIYVYGNEDPFVNESKKEEMHHLIEKSGLSFEERKFPGKHDIHRPTLAELFS
jgi:predicted esterase